jgi:signal transduction histidine kinase
MLHDLRGPLTAAAHAVQVLDVLIAREDPETRFFCEAVRRSLHRAAALVDSWQHSLVEVCTDDPPGPVDLTAVCRRVATELGLDAEGFDGTVSVDCLPQVEAGLGEMTLVFRNLLTNALRFRRNVPLVVSVGCTRIRDGLARVHVRDNGRGIRPADRPRALEPFWRGPGSSGTGLGLCIARRIVTQYGGRLWLTSRRGPGTTAYFTLPVTPRRGPRDAPGRLGPSLSASGPTSPRARPGIRREPLRDGLAPYRREASGSD